MSIHGPTLAMIMAGGKGTRLSPLTQSRAKPVMPFGGKYRVIDFTLSNCVHSGMRKIYVLSQPDAESLRRHIQDSWSFLPKELNEFVRILTKSPGTHSDDYLGTADSIQKNLSVIQELNPEAVLILGCDHIYKMDYRSFQKAHCESNADVTIACASLPAKDVHRFGIVQVDGDGHVLAFQEKPGSLQSSFLRAGTALCSMGIYIFKPGVLYRELEADSDRRSKIDFAKDVLPAMLQKGMRLVAYDFNANSENSYWKDVGTIDAYYEANMDLTAAVPRLDLYDEHWPILTSHKSLPLSKFTGCENAASGHAGKIVQSIISDACIINGGVIKQSVLSSGIRVNKQALVERSILMQGVTVGRQAKIVNAIVDAHVGIPTGMEIGVHPEEDRKYFKVTAQGVTVVNQGMLRKLKRIQQKCT